MKLEWLPTYIYTGLTDSFYWFCLFVASYVRDVVSSRMSALIGGTDCSVIHRPSSITNRHTESRMAL